MVNIPQDGSDLVIYPKKFTGVYIIAYGIMGKVSNIDPDKVYDYHTAFDIKPTEVEYNVDINANNNTILNIALDKSNNSSAATVGMVKELIPFTKKYVYRQYFEEFYDFTDANIYGLSSTSSGTQLTKTLAVVTIEPKQDKLIYNPWSSNWKKVEEGEKNHIMLSFTDTTGTLFKNLKLSFTLVFRTSFLV